MIPDFLTPTFKISQSDHLAGASAAGCDLPVARAPCGCGCSRAAPVAGGYRPSAGLRGMMPGETEGWGPGSWKGAWGPKPSTSAAAEAGWPGGGPGLLLPLHHTNKRQCDYTQYCSAPLKKYLAPNMMS